MAVTPGTIVDLGGYMRFEATLSPSEGAHTLTDLQGWLDMTEITLDTEKLPGQHGHFPPEDPLLGGRYVRVLADITTAPGGDIRTEFWRAFSAVPLGPWRMSVTDAFGTLYSDVWLSGTPRFTMGRVAWIGTVDITLFAPDMRKYRAQEPGDGHEPQGAVTLDGLHYPLYLDGYLDYGPFAVSGGFYLNNAGTIESWPTFRVRGELIDGFAVEAGDDLLVFDTTVPSGQECVLSPYAGGRAILNGEDRTEELVESGWSALQPGETRLFVFSALGDYDPAARLFPIMRDAFK
jgi:hypothetical protein